MSFEENQQKCVLCGAYLFPEDDVVYCPECGAPHHRDCYNSVGHCALGELHGTDKQYKKVKSHTSKAQKETEKAEVLCSICGEKYDATQVRCPNCNAPNFTKANGRFVTFDFLGGVPADMDLGEGVTADDAKKFVFTNTHRYIPKFADFKAGKRASWNWMAFLTPCGWLFSRKMYLIGGIAAAMQIAFSMLLMPFNKALNYLDFSAVTNYLDYSNIVVQNIDKIGMTAIVVAFIGLLLGFVLRIIFAVFGDVIYKNRVVSSVADINGNAENDKNEEFRKRGGVNIFAGLIGYFAVSELPSLIAALMGIL